MIDTVRVRTHAQPPKAQLATFWQRRDYSPPKGPTDCEYFFNPPSDGPTPFHATYRPSSHTGPHQLLIELSLPKAAYGNNWTLLESIEDGILAADEALAGHEAMPPLPSVAGMALSRLDVCHNYRVGDLLSYYVTALAKLDYPRRVVARFNTQTVEFRCKSAKTKFYDKRAEAGERCPPGLLRHEITYHTARAIKHALGTKEAVTLSTIHQAMLHALLTKDLQILSVLDRPFATISEAAARLKASYGPNRGGYRYMVLSMYQRLSREQIASELEISRATVSELLADVKRAKLSLALSDADQPLPPLQPPGLSPHSGEIAIQPPGVTSWCYSGRLGRGALRRR